MAILLRVPHSPSFIGLQAQKLGGLADNGVLLGEGHGLKASGVRSRNLSTGDTDSGGGQVVEAVLHGESQDLGRKTEHGVARFDDHDAAGLLEGGNDGLNIEGLNGAQVDNLSVDTVLLLELGGGGQGLADAARHGDDGKVLSGALDLGLADGQDEVVLLGSLAHGESLAVQELVLENNNGVGVTDSSLEQTLGILSAPRGDNLQTGNAAVPGGVILGVLGGDTGSETVGTAESDVARLNTTGHVVSLSGGVDNLIDGLHGEVEGHELANGVQTSESSTNGDTTEAGLCDGGIDNPLGAEAVEQTLGHLVCSVVLCDFLTKDEGLLVEFQLLRQGLVQGITNGDLLSTILGSISAAQN